MKRIEDSGSFSSFANADRISLIALLVANIIPLFIVAVGQWEVRSVMILYWIENVIIGIWTIARIAAAGIGRVPAKEHLAKIMVIPFFVVHYFGFCLGHLMFMVFLFRDQGGLGSELEGVAQPQWFVAGMDVRLPVLLLFVSHGISFYRHGILDGECQRAEPVLEMFRPYIRVVLLHVCLMAGAAFIVANNSPKPALILLMVGKTAMDIVIHLFMHGRSRGAIPKTRG